MKRDIEQVENLLPCQLGCESSIYYYYNAYVILFFVFCFLFSVFCVCVIFVARGGVALMCNFFSFLLLHLFSVFFFKLSNVFMLEH